MIERSGPDDFSVLRLQASYETFGIVTDYLAGVQPFAGYAFGSLARAIQQQLHDGQHLAAVTGNRLVGYAGWLLTTEAVAEAWRTGEGALDGVPVGQVPDTAALTVVAAEDRSVLFALVGEAGRLSPYRRIYYKREYATGRPARKRIADLTA